MLNTRSEAKHLSEEATSSSTYRSFSILRAGVRIHVRPVTSDKSKSFQKQSKPQEPKGSVWVSRGKVCEGQSHGLSRAWQRRRSASPLFPRAVQTKLLA